MRHEAKCRDGATVSRSFDPAPDVRLPGPAGCAQVDRRRISFYIVQLKGSAKLEQYGLND